MVEKLAPWINVHTAILIIAAFIFLRLLAALGKLICLQIQSRRDRGISDPMGDAGSRIA